MLVLLTNFLSKHWRETIFAISLLMNIALLNAPSETTSSDVKNNIVTTEVISEVEDGSQVTKKTTRKTTDLSHLKQLTHSKGTTKRMGVKIDPDDSIEINEYNLGVRLMGNLWLDVSFAPRDSETKVGISYEF